MDVVRRGNGQVCAQGGGGALLVILQQQRRTRGGVHMRGESCMKLKAALVKAAVVSQSACCGLATGAGKCHVCKLACSGIQGECADP